MTKSVFFHWFRLEAATTLEFILSTVCLLILPISGFIGLINLHVRLFLKLGLWSFSVMNEYFLASASILLSTYSFLAIFFSCAIILLEDLFGAFL